ncbi:MAG: ATP-dependent DNA helicase RecG [Candidatus Nitricoxidivorans perseverans]|uniref:ATP-dependent DNA helicase RecG n=1 Tax=Candidatus Nitricoxidivorans perseverans TaxID=2975601 RepID=A0AA49FK45_9PROT|nr:MAG: ATP-dependent DNA helicase RecG [Candidatus Nitricoxidivorans perseverans]
MADNVPQAEKLARLGLRTEADLVLHLPLRYEDETRVTAVRDAIPGVATQFEVEIISCEIAYRPRRQLISKTRDDSGALLLRFLNFYPSQQKALAAGARLRVFGEPRGGLFGTEIVHPRFRVLRGDEPLPDRLTPIYPTTAGLSQAVLRRLIERALDRADLADTLPDGLRRRLALADFGESIRFLHQPPPEISLAELETRSHPAWRRIAFDELLAQQLSLRRAYAARRKRGAPSLSATGALTNRLLASLPFKLTGAQRRVWREIAADLAAGHPMQRLLQGDVGSGKTVIAALAMLQAVEAGHQAALMAPTEILAEQHYRKLAAWLEPLGIEVAWLSGGQKKKEKAAWLAKVGAGETAIVVGTHALIGEGVEFARLGLAIVDEQHRFGVRQRLALKQKGEFAHQLTMSATPIPRTLAMSFYADLDVSVIDELPPGRTPVVTKLVSEARRDEVIVRVRDACRAGRQAYWVCPLIEESETLQLKTAEETFARLTAELPDLRVGLVHGRLKAVEKAAVMESFMRGEVQLLVATTVIEVGVDVANASLMVIEHAERFGLAQLHQLRGRVGRGAAESACILIYAGPLGETARQRLKIVYENMDGFEIARLDLQLRGPGEFIGSRQSGLLLRFADLEDGALVEQARATAEELLRDHPERADAHLARWPAAQALGRNAA